MFRRNKENKAKLEHKLYLAREAPEPIFDLSECELRNVPQGIYSLCRVFLKEVLRLECNHLSSLCGGGQLMDLSQLKVLDLHCNEFTHLPSDIHLLKNLRELYVNDNLLKKLPDAVCSLNDLVVLNVANNKLQVLPDNLGDLQNLKFLSLCGNKHLRHIPKSIYKARNLTNLEVDVNNFVYPPNVILLEGAEAVRRYICNDLSKDFIEPEEREEIDMTKDEPDDGFEAKIWKLETIKKQKLQDFLEIERANQLLQQQEFEIASAQKLDKEKLLADISQRQSDFDKQILKLQKEKEIERFHLIEMVLEAEQNSDNAIKKLLEMNSEPLTQLLEQEKEEERRLLAAADKHTDNLRKDEILADMKELIAQEIIRFQELDAGRVETSRNILEQEMGNDQRLLEILHDRDLQKTELLIQLHLDSNLQKVAVAALLERGDARSWGLLQQVQLVESQLAALTQIEMEKKKLEIDQNLNDLCDKRLHLSYLLVRLLQQQEERRQQLLSTIQTLEDCNDSDDFWLKQYQKLLEKLPEGISEAQKNIDPHLSQALLMNGVISYLPFLANLTQSRSDLGMINEEDLQNAGIINENDITHILDAFKMYVKEKTCYTPVPSAPLSSIEEASAPPVENEYSTISECVICLDHPCEVIFVPCGHLCCCRQCPVSLTECPMCRISIERKIRVIRS